MTNAFTRRRALAMACALVAGARLPFGRAPRAAAAATAGASCVLTPAKTEGPYFVDEKLERSDIRAGQAGVPLTLKLIVVDQDGGCGPVAGAQVDIWHANHSGLYSDEAPTGPAAGPTCAATRSPTRTAP